MIGIKGQFKATINGDEIASDELSEFKISDQAGLALPTIELNFNTTDKDKMKSYTEVGKVLDVGIGKDEISEQLKFVVFKRICSEGVSGSGRWYIKLWGLMDALDYLEKQRHNTYNTTKDMKKSDEVWEEVVSRYGLSPEKSSFNDKMLWLQYNITDRQFLQEVVWHGFYGKDDPCLSCITRDKRAIYKPLSKLKKVKGIIGDVDSADYFSNYYEFTQNDGMLSMWGGGKRIAPFYNLEEGANDEVWSEVSTQILGKGLKEDTRKISEYQLFGDNVHDNWIVAYEQNRILRSSLSALNIRFHFDQYRPLYPLDYVKVQWKDPKDNKPVKAISSEWLVVSNDIIVSSMSYQQHTKVSREIML